MSGPDDPRRAVTAPFARVELETLEVHSLDCEHVLDEVTGDVLVMCFCDPIRIVDEIVPVDE